MTAMLLDAQVDTKDLKVLSKNIKDIEEKDSSDFFEKMIRGLLDKVENDDAKDILLEKLLNLSNQDELDSAFLEKLSKRDTSKSSGLSKDKDNDEVFLDELLKVSYMLQNDLNIKDFSTDSKDLKSALDDKGFLSEIKGAKDVQSILDIAKKYDIKVKKFEFTKEDENSIFDKELVKKDFKSEDILKMIDKKLENSTHKLIENIKNDKTHKENTLKNLLSSISSKDTENDNKEIFFKQPKSYKYEEKNIKTSEIKVVDEKSISSKTLSKEKVLDKVKTTKNSDFSPKEVLQKEEKVLSMTKRDVKSEKKDQSSKKDIKVDDFSDHKKKIDIDQKETFETKPKVQNQKKVDSFENTQKQVFQNTNQSKAKDDIKVDDIQTKDETTQKHHESIKVEHTSQTIKSEHTKLKNHDVKQTLNTFAQDFKEQVESYKPPLMKVKMQLNPKGLGEVDVTMINRGNNLHITVNSNPNTIAIFSQNQTEFKNSLVNMGFSELNMSFNENGKNKDNQQNQKNKNGVFENIEEETAQDSFEMVTPIYI